MSASQSFVPAFSSKASGQTLVRVDFSGHKLLLAGRPKDETTYYINQSHVKNLVDLSEEVAEFRRKMIQIASETELYVQDGKFVSNNPNLILFLKGKYGVRESFTRRFLNLLKKVRAFFG